MQATRILIVDDERDIRALLRTTLSRPGVDCVCADDLESARRVLARQEFSLCLTDMRLPDGDGLDLVRHCQEQYPAMPIAVLTAHGSMESAIQALKSGAFDFLSKPVDINLLRTIVNNALQSRRMSTGALRGLVGASEPLRVLRDTIDKLARSQAPVIIYGESGTGKELAARTIHARCPRAERAFVPVNCAAIPGELLESEFFGYVKGSFTGALRDAPGLFRAADGGTLFLDEIAELPQHMQVKLLRAIQEKAVRPVGGKEEIKVDVRLLSATNQDLLRLVDSGRFRHDLYYRIHVVALEVPPLRERRDDIPMLAEHILVNNLGARGRTLSAEALARLQEYDWPGNIRELENTLERAIALSAEDVITVAALQLSRRPAQEPAQEPAQGDDLEHFLSLVEGQRIQEALARTRGDRSRAAALLGVSLRSLRYRLKKLGLDIPKS